MINRKIKIKYDSLDGECKTEISHVEDLVDIFGTEIIQEIDAEKNKFHLLTLFIFILLFIIINIVSFHLFASS